MKQYTVKLFFQVVILALILSLISGDCIDLDLGMESRSIPDGNIAASSIRNSNTPAKNGRLNYAAGLSWCASTSESNPYLQIDLRTLHIICAVSTQGNSHADEWVETYTLQISADGTTWTDYKELGLVKTFTGNNDRNTEKKNIIYEGILTRSLRFVGRSMHSSVCMRTEVFGVKQKPENLALHKLTAQSTDYNISGVSQNAVDGNRGSCTLTNEDDPSWWRVDLGSNRVPAYEVLITNKFSPPSLQSSNEDYKVTLGDNQDVTRNPECVGRYSFLDFIASAVCYNNPLRTGKYIGIMTTRRQFLSLCEVEIYSRENLAYDKTTAAINDRAGGTTGAAVDGNSNTLFSSGSCTHTASKAVKPWWRVDLERVEPVKEVYIVNRGDCCEQRLNPFEIRVGSSSSNGGVSNPKCGDGFSVGKGRGASFFCRPSLFGQYVTIRRTSDVEKDFTLCEVEVYSARRGCQIQALGLASSSAFPDGSFTASSSRGGAKASRARLNGDDAWSPSGNTNNNDYLQINLQHEFFVCAVATQGSSSADHWTKTYKLLLSLNKTDWITYKENGVDKIFNGNDGKSDIVKHNLAKITRARFIRFQPITFHSQKALRVEVYGLLKPAAPSQAPAISSVTSLNSTSVRTSWQLPPAETLHGVILGFKLLYKIRNSSDPLTSVMVASNSTLTKDVTGLGKYTEYEFQVLAFSSVGNGPLSPVRVVRTNEDVPSVGPKNLLFSEVNQTTFNISWAPLTQKKSNGKVTVFEVRRERASSGARSKRSVVSSSDSNSTTTFAVLYGFKLCSTYSISVRAYTSVGPGPFTQKTLKTKHPGAPRELEITNVGKTERILKWKKPLITPEEGMDYTVLYTGTKTYDKNFADSKKTVVGTSTEYTVTGLVLGTSYIFEVYGTSVCGKGSHVTSSPVETMIADPPSPNVTGVVTDTVISETSAVIKLWPAEQRNGPISSYQVIVLQVVDGVEDLPDDYSQRLSSAPRDELNFYIAAEITNDPVYEAPWEFTVGDEQKFEDYVNKKLERSQDYIVYQRAVTRDETEILEGKASKVAQISVTADAGGKQEGQQGGSISAAAIAVPVVLIILLVPAVGVALLFYRRRKRKQKSEAAAGHLDNMGNDPRNTTASTDDLFYSNVAEMKTILKPGKEVYQNVGKDTTEKQANTIYQNSNVNTTVVPANPIYQNIGGKRKSKGPEKADYIYSDPEEGKPKAVPVSKFAEYFKSKSKNGAAFLREEFKNLPGGMLSPWEVAKNNKAKNRYGNIVTYDHSRVVLEQTEDDSQSDYINASYIPTYDAESMCYIATQGPTSTTVNAFWQMIWQENSAIVVMLTNLVEQGKPKCQQYWPDSTSKYGDITVTLMKTENFADYIIRTLAVIKGSEKREVYQFHYTTWPDRGVPHHSTALLAFRWKVHARQQLSEGPLVVHCSAGVGRTGTFIAIDAMLESAKDQESVFIQNYMEIIRKQRPYMVQKDEQYVFLHQAVMEALVCGNTEISLQDLHIRMKKLARVHKPSKQTGYAEEFKRLQQFSESEDSGDESTTAFKPANINKNRVPNIVPVDGSRVVLRCSEPGKDYINASFVDDYTQCNAFILTQAPLSNTIEDFWRMVSQCDVGTVVMLNNLKEGKESFPQYWPSAGVVRYGNVTIELLSENTSNKITTRKFSILDAEPPKKKSTVQHLHFTGWNDPNSSPDPQEILELLTAIEKSQQQTGNGVIVFQCSDGVGRSGTVAAILSVIERIKTEQIIDVFQTIKLIRVKRPGAVVNLDQYTLCYKTILVYLDSFNTYSNFSSG